VLAAVQLTQRPGEESAATGIPPGEAVTNAAGALSSELGYQG
jgi:hypothetical protein